MHLSLKQKSRRRRQDKPSPVWASPVPCTTRGSSLGLPEKLSEVARWLEQGGPADTTSTCPTSTQGMTTDMLKFLTNKLKLQSLNEGEAQAYQVEDVADDERDSGTESDDNLEDEYPYDSKSSLTENALNNNNREPDSVRGEPSGDTTGVKTHEISEHNFDTVSCTSDYERHSLDFDRHSSEDELVTINKENVAEKRKWSEVQRCCDSAGSSDEEVKEYLVNPHPVLLSSSPPKGVQKVYSHMPSPRQVLARMAPLSVSTMSPRKRHRHNATSDRRFESAASSFTQRPCLDFEKMQKVQAFV